MLTSSNSEFVNPTVGGTPFNLHVLITKMLWLVPVRTGLFLLFIFYSRVPDSLAREGANFHCTNYFGKHWQKPKVVGTMFISNPIDFFNSSFKWASQPWLLRLNGLSASLQNERLWVRFPVRAHSWAVGQVSSWGHKRSNLSMSLPFFIPPFPYL